MKILIIGDETSQLLAESDTGLMLLREALLRGHEVFWSEPKHIGLLENKTFLQTQKVSSCQENGLPNLEIKSLFYLTEFDTIWIRKDPPFDTHYVNLCWLLRLKNDEKPLILNPPESLLLCHEKLLPMIGNHQGFFDATDLIPSTLTFSGLEKTFNHSFFNSLKSNDIIVKPWLGHGGNSIEKVKALSDVQSFINKNSKDAFLIQPFQKQVQTTGDRRAYFINCKFTGSFTRIPRSGGFVSNIAQGGIGKLAPLTKKEEEAVLKIEKFLKFNNIFIAGVDILNECISEINITAPTGFQLFKKLTNGTDLAAIYLDQVEILLS